MIPDRLATTLSKIRRSLTGGELPDPTMLSVIQELDRVRRQALALEQEFAEDIQGAHAEFRDSARNLVHYLALRRADLQDAQAELARLGLSTLGRAEAHTLASLDAVLRTLYRLADERRPDGVPALPPVDFVRGGQLLERHTEALLGPEPVEGNARIMVTFPSDAAEDYRLVRDLLVAGMGCARINCAHDGPDEWEKMVAHVERACEETGIECRVFMDLAGPKLRTGSMAPGPRVVTLEPGLDPRGRVIRAATVWLGPPHASPPGGVEPDAVLPISEDWLGHLCPDDEVRFSDTRGKPRTIRIVRPEGDGWWGECRDRVFLETGTELAVHRRGAERPLATAPVGLLPALEQIIMLHPGDTLVLHLDPRPGSPATTGDGGSPEPAHIACTLPEVFTSVEAGETIKFDDGKIEGVVRTVTADRIELEITRAKAKGGKLRADKSINLPESALEIRGLTAKDIADLDFVVRRADIVGLSFANDPEDVRQLQQELEKRNGGHLGVVLKIETLRGFQQLASLLLQGMRSHPLGIMIARGDLAAECGWERLAEVQEEILWLCEAAHVPVIWATQVLEGLAKKGLPSRAEITDAANAQRAECVMLNKGPHIVRAIHTLNDIFRRMGRHQTKKRARMRRLTISEFQRP